ncbi:MAG: LPS assembly lipoprotein LptE [Pseudomonadota bacterium]
MTLRTAALIAGLIALSACGFQPVHGPELSSGSTNISIEEIDGRTGHALRKALLQETASGVPGVESAVISVNLSESLQRIGFNSDGVSTRSSITLRGQYVVDMGDDALSGQEQSVVYYSVPASPYGDISAQNDAAERAANVLAKNMIDDITLQLTRR